MKFNEKFKKSLEDALIEARKVKNSLELSLFEKKYLLGRKSLLFAYLSNLKTIKKENEKRVFGNELNSWKKRILEEKEKIKKRVSENNSDNINNKKDNYFFQDKEIKIGNLHLIDRELEEIYDFFISRNYSIFESEEIDNTWYNFDSLNINKTHPARKLTDTFYFSDKLDILLRTHTSSCQVRAIEKNKNKSIMFISSGKVYRNDDDDLTHSHQYTNLEVVNISKNISFANLKWTLEEFFKWFFGEELKIRVRPSYFPFTEPSFEVDISCVNCNQSTRCGMCKGTKWIEILGAGLIHPKVLKNGGYKKNFSGFAIGIGIERIIMIKYRIKDIRNFYSNDLNFLKMTS